MLIVGSHTWGKYINYSVCKLFLFSHFVDKANIATFLFFNKSCFNCKCILINLLKIIETKKIADVIQDIFMLQCNADITYYSSVVLVINFYAIWFTFIFCGWIGTPINARSRTQQGRQREPSVVCCLQSAEFLTRHQSEKI